MKKIAVLTLSFIHDLLGLDLASLIPANIEVEATNASVRFSSAKYGNNGIVANGDSIVTKKTSMIDDSECEPHSIVNMSELLASSAAAYAHKVVYIYFGKQEFLSLELSKVVSFF